jgi:hypothetical protein
MSGRFVIEGTWTGYTSGQMRVVHRTVHPASRKALRAWVEKTHGISYTDGTKLLLDVRDCKPRERVHTINGYGSLIEDCAYYDVASVGALMAEKEARKATRLAAIGATA